MEFLNKNINKNPKKWKSFVKITNEDLSSDEAFDLLDKCLQYDHMDRITAEEALLHPYFNPVRDLVINDSSNSVQIIESD